MLNMKRAQGFTILELVVVIIAIIILLVLAYLENATQR